MDAKDCILTRRSIRKFTDKEITDETIKKLVSLAIYAPSWKNSQTVRYIAVKDNALKEHIANDCLGGFEWNKNIINGANVLMVEVTVNGVCGYEPNGTSSTTKGSHWQSFDAGLSAQTLCLAAKDMEIGSVILGIFDEAKVKEALSLDENYSVSALIPLGYFEHNPNPTPRKSLEEILTIK